jgi:stringent starvation protein B
MTMTSHRPYMVRALNEWILENNCTPYILVNAFAKNVQVPQDFVKDGQIVLNISPTAIQGLFINNDGIEFNGRFGGIPTPIYVPTTAIMGIYAKENGQGMVFETDDPIPEPPTTDSDEPSSKVKNARPSLRVVK